MNQGRIPARQLLKSVAIRWLVLLVALMALLFLPAGTFDYWEAWIYMAVLFVPFTGAVIYLLKTDPGLVERRMHTRERESQQKVVALLWMAWFLSIYVLPGLDRRFGWSDVPAGLVAAADCIVFIGYLLVFLVLRENSYASRVVEVEQGQKVISSGPYSVIRHPMYLGVVVMYGITPLALGTYWVLALSALIIPILAARIRNEEQVLTRELPGYQDYMQKVPYRLIPGIW
jgi:protein-S-isoprenylcysteine O-methyltransferase Ste14